MFTDNHFLASGMNDSDDVAETWISGYASKPIPNCAFTYTVA